MDLQFNSTRLTKVKDIKVPDIFNRRLKTGIEKIDSLFDQGILPGSASTLTAQAGCGKTTFMLQLLEGLTVNGYSVGYFSGEESIYQLAYTAKRVNATNVPVANCTDIDQIKQMMRDLDVLVIDSFQALTSKQKMNSRQLEKHAVQTLTRHAKVTECAVVFIMHLTKSGDLKGGTIVPHTVDVNIKIDRIADADDEAARVVSFDKNRFGPLNELECMIERAGFNFQSEVVRTDDANNKVTSKRSRKSVDYDQIVELMHDGSVDIKQIATLMDGDPSRAYTRLRDLCTCGRVEKTGRGDTARWSLSLQERTKARVNQVLGNTRLVKA